jgi:hypothetical protein
MLDVLLTTSAGATDQHPEFAEAGRAAADAQLTFVNAIRRSLGRQGPLAFRLGGAQTQDRDWPQPGSV